TSILIINFCITFNSICRIFQMPKKTKTIVITVIIIVILFLIILPKINFSSDDSSQNAQQNNKNSALPVKAHIVKGETLGNNVLTSGSIIANEEVQLKSEVAGKIVRIAFKEGSRVQNGALLV